MLKSFIKTRFGTPTLYVENQPIAAIAYTTYFTERSCCEDFIKAGYKIFFVNASFTSLPINSLRTGFTPFRIGIYENDSSPDYSEFEDEVEKILSVCHDAIIFPRLYVSMPKSWVAENAQECILTNKGGLRESLFSEKFRKDAEKLIIRFINRAKASNYADRIGGWQICGGQTQEWFHHDYLGSLSPAALSQYSEWIKKNYGNAEAHLPEKSDYDFKDDGVNKDENSRRYALFCNEKVAESVDFFASVIKRETEFSQVVGTFYGYLYENNGTVLFGTHGLSNIIDSPNLDFFSSPNAYIENRRFGIDWADMIPVDSLVFHGKLPFIECDIRTYLTKAIQDVRPGEYPDDIYRGQNGKSLWIGPPSRELSLCAIRKSFAHQLTKKAAVWWFDMWGGWYDDPLLMGELEKMKNIYDADLERSDFSYPEAEVAFFADEQAYANFLNDSPQLSSIPQTRTLMGNTGAPYRTLMVEDAEKLIGSFKAAIFPFPIPSERGKSAIAACKRQGIPYLCASMEHYPLSFEEIKDFLIANEIHLYSEENDVVYLGNGYVGLHSDKGGPKKLRLPSSFRITAIFGADFKSQITDVIEFEFQDNGTALFSLSIP